MCIANVTIEGDLDFEMNAKHRVIIRTTDKGELSRAAPFSITVVDINDKPTVGRPTTYTHYV